MSSKASGNRQKGVGVFHDEINWYKDEIPVLVNLTATILPDDSVKVEKVISLPGPSEKFKKEYPQWAVDAVDMAMKKGHEITQELLKRMYKTAAVLESKATEEAE